MTTLHCKTEHVDCDVLKKLFNDVDLYPVEEVFIMDVVDLINMFPGDEEVEYDFIEEGYVAKMRNRDEENPQILVASDLCTNEDEVGISIFHELAHHRGIQSEGKAENWARKQWNLLKERK